MKNIISTIFLIFFAISFSLGQNSVMDFYKAKELELKEMSARDSTQTYNISILKQDKSNIYISYDYSLAYNYQVGAISSPEQMRYFTAKNGEKFVATAITPKMKNNTLGNAFMPVFYEIYNGKLRNRTVKYFVKELRKQVPEAIDSRREKLSIKAYQTLTFVELSKTGNVIKIGFWHKTKAFVKRIEVCELHFNDNNATFTFVEK